MEEQKKKPLTFEEQLAQAKKKLEGAKSSTERKRLAQVFANALGKIGAGVVGQKEGVVVKPEPSKIDFSGDLDRAFKEYQTELGRIKTDKDRAEEDKLDPLEQRRLDLQERRIENEERKLAQELKREPKELTEGQKIFERESAKDLAEYLASGGYEAANLSIKRIEDAIDIYEKTDENQALASAVQQIPFFGEYFYKKGFPETAGVDQDARNAVTDTLRATLGAQFTEREGERIFNQTFDTTLGKAENLKRMNRVANRLKIINESMAERLDTLKRTGQVLPFTPEALWAESDAEFKKQLKQAEKQAEKTPKDAPTIVLMRTPDGKLIKVPEANVKEAKENGAEIVE